MKNKSFSEFIAHACLCVFIVIVGFQCAFAQVVGINALLDGTTGGCSRAIGPGAIFHRDSAVYTPPSQSKPFRWNNAGYFKSAEYTAKPKRALDFSDLPETWDGVTVATWVAYAISGISHGAGEAYHAEPYVFEKRFGASYQSFWGSQSWVRNYEGNDPSRPHKHELFGNVGRDVWHTANFVDYAPAVTATFLIGARRQPVKYRIINTLIGMGIRIVFATVTYETLRR